MPTQPTPRDGMQRATPRPSRLGPGSVALGVALGAGAWWAAMVAVAACGSSATGGAGGSDAQSDGAAPLSQCPESVAATVGARCVGAGLLCGPEYTCDLVLVPIVCTCTLGVFVCTDSTGHTLAPGETPTCPPEIDAACPPDERTASLAPCAEVGNGCSYPSACGAGVDLCECIPNSVDDGATSSLLYVCQQAACDTSSAAEGGVADGAPLVDGGPDAPSGATDGGRGDAAGEAGREGAADGGGAPGEASADVVTDTAEEAPPADAADSGS